MGGADGGQSGGSEVREATCVPGVLQLILRNIDAQTYNGEYTYHYRMLKKMRREANCQSHNICDT